mgnify:CR=1 FL=1
MGVCLITDVCLTRFLITMGWLSMVFCFMPGISVGCSVSIRPMQHGPLV